MNIYQKIFSGTVMTLSVILLVFSIRNHVILPLALSSLTLVLTTLYLVIMNTGIYESSHKRTGNDMEESLRYTFHTYREKIKVYTLYSFIFFLILLICMSMQFDFSVDTIWNQVIIWLLHKKTIVIIATIVLGALTFYFHKKREIPGKDIAENSRLVTSEKVALFNSTFPTLSKIPIVRNVMKWMYLEGWEYSIGILVITALSLYFMLPQLGGFLTVDEQRWINVGDAVKMIPRNYVDTTNPTFINTSYARSETYWDSYLSGDFKSTYNNANPSATINFLHLPAYLIKGKVNLNTYLSVARITIIIHNLFLLFVIYFLLKKIVSKQKAFLFFVILALLPQFIGYSRIINHDSIQGLYSVLFIISIWVGLKTQSKKYYIISGTFYALALLTQFKSVFIQPLLFILPLLYSYSENNFKNINHFLYNLGWFFAGALGASIIILPAVISYPIILIERLLIYPKLQVVIPLTILAFLVIMKSSKGTMLRMIIWFKKIELYLVKILAIAPVLLFFLFLYNRKEVLHLIIERTGLYTSPLEAIIASYGTLFFSTPLIIILLCMSWHIYTTIQKKTLDLSLFLATTFWILIPLLVVSSSETNTSLNIGFAMMGDRYLYILIPMLILGIITTKIVLSRKMFYITVCLVCISLFVNNLIDRPMYIMHNNIFVPKHNLIQKTTWASDTGETTRYINNNLSDITIYNPRGNIEFFLKKDIRVIQWYRNFWEYSPDYIIVEWEKDHQFTKVFDYYRENKEPIWSITKNGTILTGIYQFDPNLNYEDIINQ